MLDSMHMSSTLIIFVVLALLVLGGLLAIVRFLARRERD